MTNNQFYNMSNNTCLSRGWTYAPSFYPVDNYVRYNCPKCGAIAYYPTGKYAIDLEGGTKYPDILLCGAYPLLIVSERVRNDWVNSGITGFVSFPLEIREIASAKLKTKEPVQYYGIEVSAKCELDLVAMDVEITNKCDKCGNIRLSKNTEDIQKLVIKSDSVGNFDIFVSEIFPAKIFVSERVVKCACINKHTNFSFIKAEESLNLFSESIDYLKYCKE